MVVLVHHALLVIEVHALDVHVLNLEVLELVVRVLISARNRRHEFMASRYSLTVRVPDGLFNPLQGTVLGQTVRYVLLSGHLVHPSSSPRHLVL